IEPLAFSRPEGWVDRLRHGSLKFRPAGLPDVRMLGLVHAPAMEAHPTRPVRRVVGGVLGRDGRTQVDQWPADFARIGRHAKSSCSPRSASVTMLPPSRILRLCGTWTETGISVSD